MSDTPKKTSEAAVATPKNATHKDSEPVTPVRSLTLDEFIVEEKPNPGLVASFKVEEKNLEPRSYTAWKEALTAQSKRIYK